MRPEFSAAIDPIFLATHQFLQRLERSERIVVSDERARLIRLIDSAEAALGKTEEWELAKFALCGWIDAIFSQAPWDYNRWWADNCLEFKYFGHKIAYHEFFRRAQLAEGLARKDALEVYYLAVVLGFRGFYGDADSVTVARQMRLPDTLEIWCQTVGQSLQVRQGRPTIDETMRPAGAAPPLRARASLVNATMATVALVALAIGVWIFPMML